MVARWQRATPDQACQRLLDAITAAVVACITPQIKHAIEGGAMTSDNSDHPIDFYLAAFDRRGRFRRLYLSQDHDWEADWPVEHALRTGLAALVVEVTR